MLQRAASNAYSWWMASNIRTNQSKWLDSDLQEMEVRVQAMLKIVEEDADSFAKRADMYYKRRPELINYVQETYRAYRALAERYDRISGELHRANHTLATAFPDLQFPMQDEDDDGICPHPSAPPSNSTDHRPPPPEFPQVSLLKRTSESKPPLKKSIQRLRSKSLPTKPASLMTEGEANEAIDKLQKGILVLQTEKEFIKSSYEGGIAKYWEIEKRITEMQEEVTSLQDEFGASVVIDDDEARSLMVVTALKSCKDSISNLHEQQRISIQETKVESERLRTAREKLRSLERGGDKDVSDDDDDDGTGISSTTSVGGEDVQKQTLELQPMCDKFKEPFEINSDTSVAQLVEKIDELVNKVISLELTVSSQTAQISCLRSEIDDIQKHLSGFEEERNNSNDHQLKQAEEEEEEEGNAIQLHPIISSNSTLLLTSNGDMEVAKSEEEPEDASSLLSNGSEGSEKILLAEYTSILRSYRETKRKLLQVEKKNQEYFAETMVQVKELKNANSVKDDDIRCLRQKLSNLQKSSRLQGSEDQQKMEAASNNRDAGMKPDCSDEPQSMSPMEEKFRRDIDTLLDENLQFWLRFCTSFHQIQRFREGFQALQGDVEQLKDGKTQQEGSISSNSSAEQAAEPAAPADKKLRELKTELQVWTEQNALLRGELQSRFSSLCNIQEEITGVLKATAETDFDQFTPYQAAKFQGEVLNLKQENNKVADELQAGLDHVKALQSQVEEAMSKLDEKMELSTSKSGHHHSSRHFSSKSKGVPLRSFLYGAKPKKPSIFSSH